MIQDAHVGYTYRILIQETDMIQNTDTGNCLQDTGYKCHLQDIGHKRKDTGHTTPAT